MRAHTNVAADASPEEAARNFEQDIADGVYHEVHENGEREVAVRDNTALEDITGREKRNKVQDKGNSVDKVRSKGAGQVPKRGTKR